MKNLEINHTEYADDSIIWYSDSDLKVVEMVVGSDTGKIDGWCDKWNMGGATEKTDCLKVGLKEVCQQSVDIKIKMV